eukprot:87678_1
MMNYELIYWLLSVWFKSIFFAVVAGLIMLLVCYYQCKMSDINRWHWLEIHDENWCPNVLKEYLRRILYEICYADYLCAGDRISKVILPVIKKHNISLILDLCSGSCGPSTIINQYINKVSDKNKQITTILTDLFPQINSWKVFQSKNKNILYSTEPIDA